MTERLKTFTNMPLHQYLGVESITSEAGNGTLVANVSEQTLNMLGVYHGGVTYTLCDVCAYGGLLSLMADDEDAVTHDFHVSLIRSVKAGETVVFTSTLLKKGRNLCFFDVQAKVGDKLVATARVTKSLLQITKK